MRTGLKAFALSQFGRVVLRVGWVRRQEEDPDEYDVVMRTVYRRGADRYTPLGNYWLTGEAYMPGTFSLGVAVPAEAHRAHIVPLANLDPEAWPSCPKPAGW
jgi:hypothetical protein